VAQRSIELVIGRLATDEEFRQTFQADPRQTLAGLLARGTHLNHTEIEALVATDRLLWSHVADRIDPRLQKANLRTDLASADAGLKG
jgi:hypothetical protein